MSHPRAYANPKPFDPDELRYHIYRLYDGAGRLLYIGRSYDPLERLRDHHSKTEWAGDVVSVDGHGPYKWADVVRIERQEILDRRPLHNIDGVTKNTHRSFAQMVGSCP